MSLALGTVVFLLKANTPFEPSMPEQSKSRYLMFMAAVVVIPDSAEV